MVSAKKDGEIPGFPIIMAPLIEQRKGPAAEGGGRLALCGTKLLNIDERLKTAT